VVDSGVGDNDDSGLLERLGDVVGEVTGGESASNGLGTGETSHLEDSSVTVGSGRDDGNVVGVLDGGEDSGSKDELLPSLTDVEDVDTWMLVVSRKIHPITSPFQPSPFLSPWSSVHPHHHPIPRHTARPFRRRPSPQQQKIHLPSALRL
jgi:hypothetical protein